MKKDSPHWAYENIIISRHKIQDFSLLICYRYIYYRLMRG